MKKNILYNYKMNTYKFIIGYIVVSTALMMFLNKLNIEGVDKTLAPPISEENTEDSGMEAETMEEEPPIVQGEGEEGGMGSMVDKALEMMGKGFDLFVQITTLVLLVMIFMKVRAPSLS